MTASHVGQYTSPPIYVKICMNLKFYKISYSNLGISEPAKFVSIQKHRQIHGQTFLKNNQIVFKPPKTYKSMKNRKSKLFRIQCFLLI